MPGVSTMTELANLAIDALGEQKRLLNVETDNTAVSRSVVLNFWPTWDETLRGYPWDCAKKRRAIAAMTQAPAFGFRIQYPLPEDYIGIQELPDFGEFDRYSVEAFGEPPANQLVLACDVPAPLNLVYTYRLRSIAQADDAFKGAFVQGLAFKIAPALTKDTRKQTTAFQLWRDAMSLAQAADARQGPRRRPPDSAIVSCRE